MVERLLWEQEVAGSNPVAPRASPRVDWRAIRGIGNWIDKTAWSREGHFKIWYSLGCMEQWLRDNPGFVIGVASSIVAAIILGFLAFFGKRILAIVIRWWTQMGRALKIGHTAQPPDLRFVAIPMGCRIGVIERDDQQPNVQINTSWYVTNASTSGMPAQLLRARLAKPRVNAEAPLILRTRKLKVKRIGPIIS